MWKIIGTQKPTKNVSNRGKARLAFQNLWVAGTLGAFFVALATNLPSHILQFSWSPDPIYTISIYLKYGYLLWFLSYFFISNLKNEQQEQATKRDLFFDVTQSTVALISAYALGFIVSGVDLGFTAYIIANAAIFLICILSLCFYGCGASEGVNRIRVYVAIIAVLSIITLKYYGGSEQSQDITPYLIVFMLLVFHWLLFWPYIFIRLDREAWK
jgi:hypothetical protein